MLNSDVGLDLHLKRPFRQEDLVDSAEESISDTEMTDLRLSSIAIKSELLGVRRLTGTRKVELNGPNSVDLEHLKAEPCEGTFRDKTSKTAAGEESETHDGQVHQSIKSTRSTRKKSCQLDFDLNCEPVDYDDSLVKDKRCERMDFDLNREPMDFDGCMVHELPAISIDANINLYADEITGESLDIVDQPRAPVSSHSCCSKEMASDSSAPHAVNGIDSETSDSISQALISRVSAQEANDSTEPASDMHPELSEAISDNQHANPHGITNIAETDEKIDMSTEIQDQESHDEMNGSVDAISSRDMVLDYDEEYEDGEVRDMIASPSAVEVAVEQREEEANEEETIGIIRPANAPVIIAPHVQMQSSDELRNRLGDIEYNSAIHTNQSDSSVSTMLNPYISSAGFGYNRPIESNHKTKRGFWMKSKCFKNNSKFRKTDNGGRTIESGSHNVQGEQHENAIISAGNAIKHENGWQNSSPNSLWFQKNKGGPAREMDSHNKRNAFTNRPLGRDKAYHQRRIEIRNDGLWTEYVETNPIGKSGPDSTFRRGGNRFGAPQCDQNFDSRYMSESTKFRCNGRFWTECANHNPTGNPESDFTLARRIGNRINASHCNQNSNAKYVPESSKSRYESWNKGSRESWCHRPQQNPIENPILDSTRVKLAGTGFDASQCDQNSGSKIVSDSVGMRFPMPQNAYRAELADTLLNDQFGSANNMPGNESRNSRPPSRKWRSGSVGGEPILPLPHVAQRFQSRSPHPWPSPRQFPGPFSGHIGTLTIDRFHRMQSASQSPSSSSNHQLPRYGQRKILVAMNDGAEPTRNHQRDFVQNIKNRPLNGSNQQKGTEEQEEKYRNNGGKA